MRRWTVLGGLSLLVACQSNQAVLLPTLEGARSYFMAGFGPLDKGDSRQPVLQGSLQPRFAEAFDAGDAAAFAHVRGTLTSIELQAFPCSLEELALEAGPLNLGTVPRENGPALPPAIGAWSLAADSDQFEPTALTPPGPLSESFDYWQVPSLCERVAPRITKENAFRETGVGNPLQFDMPVAVVEHPRNQVLLLTQTGRLLRILREGGTLTSTFAIAKKTVGMAQAEAGAVWALDELGALHLVAEDGTVTDFPGHAHVAIANTSSISNLGPLGFVALDSGGSSNPSDLYAVADDRVLMHYDGQEWETLLSSELRGWKVNPSMDFEYVFPYLPRLVRLGPRSLVVNGLADEERKVVFWEDGRARVVKIDGAGTISALLRHPVHGLLAGDLDGHIFRYSPETRTFSLYAEESGAQVFTLAADGDSVWFNSLDQMYTQDPLAGLCGTPVREVGVDRHPLNRNESNRNFNTCIIRDLGA